MLVRYLFPNRFKKLGWVLVLVSLILWMLEQFSRLELPLLLNWLPSLWNDERPGMRQNHDLYALLFIAGALLVACSRERHEDEYINQLRLESLLWALYAYCGLLALAILLVSGTAFFAVMMYAMFAPLILFLLRFQMGIYLVNRTPAHD